MDFHGLVVQTLGIARKDYDVLKSFSQENQNGYGGAAELQAQRC